MNERVELSVFYPYPIDKIWHALTDRRILNTWMMNNDFEPHLGHKFKFENHSLPGRKTVIHCEVVELEKPKRLVYTWQDKATGKPSLVTWTLNPVEGGTQLELKHLRTGYATTFVTDRSRDFEQINTRAGLLFYEKPISNFSQQMLQTVPRQRAIAGEFSFLVNRKDSKEQWNYRLNHKLLETLNSGLFHS